jgi:hypothetical protein
MSKAKAVILIAVLVLSSLVMVEAVFAQSIPKPSVPEFTLKYVEDSSDVHNTIEVSVKNQQFTSDVDNMRYPLQLCYNIRAKRRSDTIWVNFSRLEASDSEYTYYTSRWGSRIADDKVDFQVQAVIGYFESRHSPDAPYYFGWYEVFVLVGSSGWSATQTLDIEEVYAPSPEPTSTPYSEPQIEQDVILGLAITVAVLAVGLGLLVYLIKRK